LKVLILFNQSFFSVTNKSPYNYHNKSSEWKELSAKRNFKRTYPADLEIYEYLKKRIHNQYEQIKEK